MSTKLPSDLWRAIYDIQGEAQQAAEGDRPCRSIEDTWARLEKVLPEPYASAPDLLEALKAARTELEAAELEFSGEGYNNPKMNAVIARAEGTGPDAPPVDK